jgi:glycosyltransferase involved in cell wall biosynthesis
MRASTQISILEKRISDVFNEIFQVKIIHVVPHVGHEASGPSYSVSRLAQSLAAVGNDVTLMSVKDGLLPNAAGFQHQVFPKSRMPSQLWRSPGLYKALCNKSTAVDVIHSHGLWLMPNVYPGWAAKQKSTPLVISPRGTLSSWALANSAVRKKIFWKIFQGSVLAQAACLHATAEHEYVDIRKCGLKQPICIIPNGVDIPPLDLCKELDPNVASDGHRELLFLGRLHTVKGLDILIDAWAKIVVMRPDWRLRIVGPDDGKYATKLRDRVSAGAVQNCIIDGALYGREKQAAYQRAELYVLPTHSENFGMTVAEALANGTPVITTTNAPWSELNIRDCGWSIELSEQNLIDALLDATSRSHEELSAMGFRGRDLVQEKYGWKSVATQMTRVYSWLLGKSHMPDCVRLD